MPLTFDSLSHGTIAFGFFNIESDMLLCDRYFIFADTFCKYVEDIAEHTDKQIYQTLWTVQFINSSESIGDLMGAIHGIRYTGFIGDLYRRFPFPPDPQDFKQNPQGFQTQAQVFEIISKYSESLEIHIVVKNAGREIEIGDYRFSRIQFQELIRYVWRGGYPRWKDEIRPDYVTASGNKILRNRKGIFKGIDISYSRNL